VKLKRVVRRARSDQDVREAIQYYLEQNAPDAALAFITALEQAIAHIQRHPASGSPRYAHALDLPGLRSSMSSGLVTSTYGAFCTGNATFRPG
jgi:toxin ParE1/3/4